MSDFRINFFTHISHEFRTPLAIIQSAVEKMMTKGEGYTSKNNIVDAGDDGICMKGGAGAAGVKAGPCENINIQDNTVYHAHGGFVIGSRNGSARRCASVRC